MEQSADAPRFDDLAPEEVRVLGCLIEKESTVPDSYPLTLNSLRTACNQSTSRDPVVDYGQHEIEQALASLRARGLTRTVHSTSNRAAKYRHVAPEVLDLDPAETAVLAVLMLRGPQTVGELKSRTERQYAFGTIDEVATVLEGLAERPTPLVTHLERQPGQKDVRWIHLLAPRDRATATAGTDTADTSGVRDVTDDEDPYAAATAEFYDLLATVHWGRYGIELIDLLDGVDPRLGPVVDVGAGTGVGLGYLLAAVPDATVYAIEPSKAMRVALHTRLALDESLRAAVTVDPRRLADASLPSTASALLMAAVLGHLTDDERTKVWRYVADSMPPGAPAVIEVLPPWRPVEVPLTRYRELPVGGFTYEGWQSGVPSGEREMRWTMIYRVLRGEEQIAEHTIESRWRCWSPDDVRDEVAPFGLTVTAHDGFVIVRR